MLFKNFLGNALRLGVELYKNPNELRIINKEPFNQVASIQRIRSKVGSLELARNEKEKRLRRLAVQQKRDKLIYGEIKEEEDL